MNELSKYLTIDVSVENLNDLSRYKHIVIDCTMVEVATSNMYIESMMYSLWTEDINVYFKV